MREHRALRVRCMPLDLVVLVPQGSGEGFERSEGSCQGSVNHDLATSLRVRILRDLSSHGTSLPTQQEPQVVPVSTCHVGIPVDLSQQGQVLLLAVILVVPALFMLPMLFMLLDFLMRPVLHSVPTTFVIFGKDNHYYAGPRTPVDECTGAIPGWFQRHDFPTESPTRGRGLCREQFSVESTRLWSRLNLYNWSARST